MTSVRVLGCLATVALSVVALGGSTGEQVAWAPGLPAALEQAKARKVPLLVVVNMDAERGNDAMVAEVYTAAAVREACKRCVTTIASLGKHAALDAGGRSVCSRFGSVTCAEHQATEKVVREDWLKRKPEETVDSPRHMFLTPEGRLLFERVWTLDAEELTKLIDRAVRACAPESLAAWDTTPARLARVAEPLACVRAEALRALLAMKDAAVDAQLLDLVRKSDKEDLVRDVLSGMSAELSIARGDGIRKLLAAPSAAARAGAVAAIARLKAADAFDTFCGALAKEKNLEVKCVLVRALAVCGGEPAKARDTLLKHAKSGDPVVRVHAVVALAPWAAEGVVFEALRKMPGNDKLPEHLRAAACWMLGLSGRAEAGAELEAAAESRAEVLKHAATRARARLQPGAPPDPNYLHLRGWIAPLSVYLQGERQE